MAKAVFTSGSMPVDRAPGPGGDEPIQPESACHAWSQHGRGPESEELDAEKGNRRIAEIPRPVGLEEKAPWAKAAAKKLPAKLRDLLKRNF
jgi:hypothetical protein